MILHGDALNSKACKERFLKIYKENNLNFATYNWLLTGGKSNNQLKALITSLDLVEEDKTNLYYYAKRLKGSLKGEQEEFKRFKDNHMVLAYLYKKYPEYRLKMVLESGYDFDQLLLEYKPKGVEDLLIIDSLKDYVYNYGITFNNIEFYNEYRKIIDLGYTNYELEDILATLYLCKENDYDGIKLDNYQEKVCKTKQQFLNFSKMRGKLFMATLDPKELRRMKQTYNHLEKNSEVTIIRLTNDSVRFSLNDCEFKVWLGNRRGLEVYKDGETLSYVLKRKDRLSLKDLTVPIETLGEDYSWLVKVIQMSLK